MAEPHQFRSVFYDDTTGVFYWMRLGGRMVPIGSTPPGGPPNPPSDGNTYPLTMQPVASPGATVDIGTGPNTLTLLLACSPGTPDGQRNVVAVLIGDKVIAAPLTVSSTSGMSAGQVFNIHGAFGAAPLTVSLANGNAEANLANLWINGISLDFLPLVYNGPSVDARGAKPPPNATSLWDNIGVPVTFSTERVLVGAPPPEPVLTVVKGAAINGVVVPDATLADLVAASAPGALLKLPAGVIFGTTPMGPITIEGAGQGKTIIDCTGLAPAFGKAVFVPTASGAVLRDLTIRGAAGPDNNAAGVRQQGNGIGFALERVEIHHCQDGILAFDGDITLTDCYTHDNGAGDGFSHEMYFSGGPHGSVTLINHRSVCGVGATHALKSRHGTTIVIGGSFTGSSDPHGSVGGSVIDIPNAGLCSIAGAAIIMGGTTAAPPAQRELIGYGLENANNGDGGLVLEGVAVTITAEAGYIHSARPAATLTIKSACVYNGPAPTLNGWGEGMVTGAFSPA